MTRTRALAQPIAAIGLAFILGGIVILISGANPVAAYSALMEGAFGTIPNLFRTLAEPLPSYSPALAWPWRFAPDSSTSARKVSS